MCHQSIFLFAFAGNDAGNCIYFTIIDFCMHFSMDSYFTLFHKFHKFYSPSGGNGKDRQTRGFFFMIPTVVALAVEPDQIIRGTFQKFQVCYCQTCRTGKGKSSVSFAADIPAIFPEEDPFSLYIRIFRIKFGKIHYFTIHSICCSGGTPDDSFQWMSCRIT